MPDDQLQRVLDTRAIELAAGTSAVVAQHLVECRDRYIAIAASIDRLYGLLWKTAGATILMLLAIIGWFAIRLILSVVHP